MSIRTIRKGTPIPRPSTTAMNATAVGRPKFNVQPPPPTRDEQRRVSGVDVEHLQPPERPLVYDSLWDPPDFCEAAEADTAGHGNRHEQTDPVDRAETAPSTVPEPDQFHGAKSLEGNPHDCEQRDPFGHRQHPACIVILILDGATAGCGRRGPPQENQGDGAEHQGQ